jgi:drug/metabolite transporter (DMT)-like permease
MLMALPPVIILPISYFAFKEKIGWQATLGTALAIAGAAIFSLHNSDGESAFHSDKLSVR